LPPVTAITIQWQVEDVTHLFELIRFYYLSRAGSKSLTIL
jgi:hypothetical protein